MTKSEQHLPRRSFVKWVGGFGGLVASTALARLIPEVEAAPQATENPLAKLALQSTGGELFGGFLLLPEGAPVPAGVQDYRLGIPTMCGVTDGDLDASLHTHGVAEHVDVPDAKVLRDRGNLPIYEIADPHQVLVRPLGASIIRHDNGDTFGGWLTYSSVGEVSAEPSAALSIWIQMDYQKPFPIWASPFVELQKVGFTPGGAGILIRNPFGYAMHWIENESYYMLSVDDLSVRGEPEDVARALVRVI